MKIISHPLRTPTACGTLPYPTPCIPLTTPMCPLHNSTVFGDFNRDHKNPVHFPLARDGKKEEKKENNWEKTSDSPNLQRLTNVTYVEFTTLPLHIQGFNEWLMHKYVSFCEGKKLIMIYEGHSEIIDTPLVFWTLGAKWKVLLMAKWRGKTGKAEKERK